MKHACDIPYGFAYEDEMEDKKMSIKDTLIEAGRYTQVMDYLRELKFSSESNFPVNCYNDNGKASFGVNGSDVRNEAGKLIDGIDKNTIVNMKLDDFNNLFQYVHTDCDIMLHNYAVSVSHRNTPEDTMEKIRILSIIDNLILCLNINEFTEDIKWSIPDGWKSNNAALK